MRVVRPLVLVLVIGALVVAFVIDREPRPSEGAGTDRAPTVPVGGDDRGIWFCPGGSSPNGDAAVSLEIVNAGPEPAGATVTGVRSGTGPEARTTDLVVEPGERVDVPLSELVPDSAWMGAVVEVDRADTVVEQLVLGPAGELDHMTCHTDTSTSWIVASGATRTQDLFGERMVLLVLNPFLDDAVVDISFESDVGVESLTGVVVPARRVVPIEVTDEVTIASRVSAVVDVVAGRVAVSRLQFVANDEARGLASTAAAGASPVWYLPVVHRGDRNDTISVVNPSRDVDAEVDLEILVEGDRTFDPIQLTVPPGRAVQVSPESQGRFEGVERFAVIARSLTGTPVGVMVESLLPRADDDSVTNLAASPGSDAAATGWIAPLETDEGGVVVMNPSPDSIVTVVVSAVDGSERREVTSIELGPMRWAEIGADEVGGERPVVVLDASAPVVAARIVAGVSSYALPAPVATGTVVPAG